MRRCWTRFISYMKELNAGLRIIHADNTDAYDMTNAV